MNIDSNSKILVVAPHPDDESIGCGGLILKYHSQIDILLVTDGQFGDCSWATEPEEIVRVREHEFLSAMKYAKVNKVYRLNIPEGALRKYKRKLAIFDYSCYDQIYLPNKYESHPDHSAIYKIIRKRLNVRKQDVFQYEVWTPLRYPSHKLDITDRIDDKRELIQYYRSQLEGIDYIGKICGLNRYRYTKKREEDILEGYAEAYLQVDGYIKEMLKNIYHELPWFLSTLIKKCNNKKM